MPIPERPEDHKLICPECGGRMLLKYSTRFTRWFYGCVNFPNCTVTHGCHADGAPFGVPADQRTRMWRKRAHRSFDRLWKGGLMSRREAYGWLQEVMELPEEDAHIGNFNERQCWELIQKARAVLGESA